VEYVLGLIAVVAAVLLLRDLLQHRPIHFKLDGERFVRLPDGSFCRADGSNIGDPARAEQVRRHWQAMEQGEAAEEDG
jgi:hypothetical protein